MISHCNGSLNAPKLIPFVAQFGVLAGFSYVGWKVRKLDPTSLSKLELGKRVASVGISTISQMVLMRKSLENKESSSHRYLYHTLSCLSFIYLLVSKKISRNFSVAVFSAQLFISEVFLGLTQKAIYEELYQVTEKLQCKYNSQEEVESVHQEALHWLSVLNKRENPPGSFTSSKYRKLACEWVRFTRDHINQVVTLYKGNPITEFKNTLDEQQQLILRVDNRLYPIVDPLAQDEVSLFMILTKLDNDKHSVKKYISQLIQELTNSHKKGTLDGVLLEKTQRYLLILGRNMPSNSDCVQEIINAYVLYIASTEDEKSVRTETESFIVTLREIGIHITDKARNVSVIDSFLNLFNIIRVNNKKDGLPPGIINRLVESVFELKDPLLIHSFLSTLFMNFIPIKPEHIGSLEQIFCNQIKTPDKDQMKPPAKVIKRGFDLLGKEFSPEEKLAILKKSQRAKYTSSDDILYLILCYCTCKGTLPQDIAGLFISAFEEKTRTGMTSYQEMKSLYDILKLSQTT